MNTKKIFWFIFITLLISWMAAGVYYLASGEWGTLLAMVFAAGYMFFPLLGVIIVQKYIYKEPVIENLGVKFNFNYWWLAAWLLPVALVFATIGTSLLFPGVTYSPEMEGIFEYMEGLIPEDQMEEIPFSPQLMFWLMLVQGLFAGPTINAVAGFGEELGWRGILLNEMAPLGFWKSSVIIGFIWGIWHAPLILMGHNYPGYEIIGVGMMIIWCILLSPLFTYITVKANSVIAAAVLHGSLNATLGLAIMPVKGANVLTVGAAGLAGFAVLIVVNLLLLLWVRPQMPDKSMIFQEEN